jgi:CBS domain containing-hemolysin-like protein
MATWCVLIAYKLYHKQIQTTRTVNTALRTLIQYPLIVLLMWFLNMLGILLNGALPVLDSFLAGVIIMCIASWQGGVTALAFFISSRESRLLWFNIFRKIYRSSCSYCCLINNSSSLMLTRRSHADGVDEAADLEDEMNIEEEDFESDDTYYGRLGSIEDDQQRRQSTEPHISMTEIKNPFVSLKDERIT